MSSKRKLGEILTELGLIENHQLHAALEHQKRFKNKLKLGASLVALGFITEEQLTEVLSRYLNIALVNLSLEFITPEIIDLVSSEVAERFQIMPFKILEENKKKILCLAMADPTNLEPVDIIQFSTSLNIRPFVATPSDVDRCIQRHYHGILVDGISYVGTAPNLDPEGREKIKIISRGNEITWNGNLTGLKSSSDTMPNDSVSSSSQSLGFQGGQRVSTSKSPQNDQVMGEMLKLLRESNALMKVLIKKGIISEEEVDSELKSDE